MKYTRATLIDTRDETAVDLESTKRTAEPDPVLACQAVRKVDGCTPVRQSWGRPDPECLD